MVRPLYCPDLKDDEECPACGATAERGVCRAINSGPPPRPLVELVLVHRNIRNRAFTNERTEAITNPIITAFLERAAKAGYHLRPDEATEAMSLAGIAASGAGNMTTGGPEDAYQIVWRAMGRVALVYEGG